DSATSDEVMKSICAVMRERRKTLVMVTHDRNMASYADRIISLLDGRVVDIKVNDHSRADTDTTEGMHE
ncbi:MAG TPA: ABC transporter ATP-binding protein, partial [Clostridia bacterium]|nr:ABC transporter ATP-binding protein [Clostridia bacterium]